MALKVLLVEDTVGMPMSKVLNKWGYEVSLAVDGEDAWKQISEKSFDCFLIDWMLPGISGIELIQKLRQTPPHLLSANRSQSEFAVILVCNTPTDIPFGQQADLEELSVSIYQRAEFNEQTWQHLIEEYVVPDEDI
ncbi:MAG: response regulator transcription factor [Candidatus Latescibacterota bacterium]|jgi:CheY-like chemotaxis protein